jgi:hypothetical protein
MVMTMMMTMTTQVVRQRVEKLQEANPWPQTQSINHHRTRIGERSYAKYHHHEYTAPDKDDKQHHNSHHNHVTSHNVD